MNSQLSFGLHQGFSITVFFVQAMDKLTSHVQDGILWYMLFAKDQNKQNQEFNLHTTMLMPGIG
jgi:hypothetical protein